MARAEANGAGGNAEHIVNRESTSLMPAPSDAPRATGEPPGLAAPAALAQPLAELERHLADLHAILKDLAALAGEKLAALRAADTAGLEECAAREGELLRRVHSGEPTRRALLARVAQHLRCRPPGRIGLIEIADRLPEPRASSLRARSVALREIAAELQRKNQLVATVARNLQAHIRGVFAEVAKAAQESVVYGPAGRHEAGNTRSWVDAVG